MLPISSTSLKKCPNTSHSRIPKKLESPTSVGSKKLKLSSTVDNLLQDIDWDMTWDGSEDDPDILTDSTGGTKTSSSQSYTTALTSLPPESKTRNSEKSDDNQRPGAESRQRNMCRIIGKLHESRSGVIYKVTDISTGCDATLYLQDIWAQQDLPTDWLVNIVGVQMNSEKQYTVNRSKGYLVVAPDNLMSVTLVTHQMWCDREAVFKCIIQLFGGNRNTLRGIICHELLAKVLVHKPKGVKQDKILLQEILKLSHIVRQAYELKMTQEELEGLGAEVLPYMTKFKGRIVGRADQGQTWTIDKVRDIEDTYWNPLFGIKGKLDATIDIMKPDGTFATVPMEVKTGNPSFEGMRRVRDDHVGQLSLYSLLMSSRYKDVKEGLLYYVREDFWQECSVKPLNLQGLITMRNKLAINSTSRTGQFPHLPPPTAEFDFKCKNCDYKDVCSLFVRKGKLNEEERKTGTEIKLLGITPHLGQLELEYFHNWFAFITLEIEASDKLKKMANLWNLKPEERFQSCLPGLKLVKCWQPSSTSGSFRQYHAKFKAAGSLTNLTIVDIKQNDFLVVGTNNEVCVSYCVVECITSEPFSITVSLESDLRGKSPDGLYNLDKINSYNPMFINYAYLARLMENTVSMKRLRDYLIHKKEVVMKPLKNKIQDEFKIILQKYNRDQQRAITKSLCTDSYLFVKGMPGTGKTETIVGLLRMLVAQGKTVLLVAYTTSAVDNIMLKYMSFSKNFIRMGKELNFRKELRPYSYDSVTAGITNVDELRAKLDTPPVIATTLLSLNHEIFSNRSFDYAILDEISQSLPVSCIGALSKANKYIFFGDPEQLPPVIVADRARLLELDETLFASLSSVPNTVNLTIQYRMNETIMYLANELTYKGQMTCFSEELKKAYLNLPTEKLRSYITAIRSRPMQLWLSFVASKKLSRSVLFLDTSEISALDSYKNHSIKNETEVAIAMACLKLFLTCGLKADDVGLIAPYTAQVNSLRQARNRLAIDQVENVEINTVDQYQGRDKTVIVCSFTKSSEKKSWNSEILSSNEKKATILDDKRRLNVAITRAKRKLIMIGHMQFLKTFEPLRDLFAILTPEQVVHLKPEQVGDLLEKTSPLKTLP